MPKDPNGKVKIKNDLLRLDTSSYSLTDKRFIVALLYLAKDKPAGSVINLTFQDLKRLGIYTEQTHLSKKQIRQQVNRLYDHLLTLPIRTYKQDGDDFQKEYIPLFSKATLRGTLSDVESYVASIKVNPEALPYLSKLMRGYTAFPLLDFQSLKSGYSQNLYFSLIQFSDTGWRTLSKPQFLADMDAKAYPEKEITRRILKPAISELSAFFPDLQVEKIKTGKIVTGYQFSWTPVKSFDPARLPSFDLFESWAYQSLHFLTIQQAWDILNKSKKPISDWRRYITSADKRAKQQYTKQLLDKTRKQLKDGTFFNS